MNYRRLRPGAVNWFSPASPRAVQLGGLANLLRPLPAGNVGPVRPVLKRIVTAGDLIVEKLAHCRPADQLQSWHILNCIHGQGETIDLILDSQLQWGIDVALFHIAVDVDVGMIRAAVGQAVDQPRVSVEIEDDWFVSGKEQIEIRIR